MTQDHKARIFGAILFVVSLSFVIWSWYSAINYGYFYQKFALIFPLFTFLGLGALIFGTDNKDTQHISSKEELEKFLSENEIVEMRVVEEPRGSKQSSKGWWVVLGVGAVATAINYSALSYFLGISLSSTLFWISIFIIAIAFVVYLRWRS